MEHVALLLLISFFFLCRAQECREQAVAAKGALQLLPEKPPKEWVKVAWRVSRGAGHPQRILTAGKNKSELPTQSPFSGRAVFQWDTLSLRVNSVSPADSGVYRAEFEDVSGAVTISCFHVSVWEPIHQSRLEMRVLHQEQGRCNLSLLCTVPGAEDVSYSWSCTGDPAGALEHHPRLQLQVDGDADPTVCHCNASNPVSWATASSDVAAACRAAAAGTSWSYCRVKGLLCLLVLGSLVATMAVTYILVWPWGPPSRSGRSSSGAG